MPILLPGQQFTIAASEQSGQEDMMDQISSAFGRPCALAPAAILLLVLCLLAGGAQAATGPVDTATLAVVAAPLFQTHDGVSYALAGYETPIVVSGADQVEPAIYGSRIIWRDMRYDNYVGDIFSYDLASHLELPEIASRSDYGKFTTGDYDPVISDAGIFSVWGGRSDGDTNMEIQGRTLAGEPINVTIVGEPSNRDLRDLAIDGTWMVYVYYNNYYYSLIKYDTTSHQYWTVRKTTNEIRSPDISGDTIVWQEYDGNDWNIWYNPQGQVSTLANDPGGDQVSPAIDGTRVVWVDNRSGNWDLYTADLSQPNPTGVPWLVAPGDQTEPQLSGDRLVWQDNRDGDWDIYQGSVSSGAVAPVCTANGDQEAPAVDGDRIVWQDDRNGNWNIYMFTLSSTGPVPVPTPAPLVITSPGTYSVTADGYDGNATPIEIRSSDVVLDGGNHTIDGTGQPGSCGIRIGSDAGTLSNIVVRNIQLTNWETGIRADKITGSVIEASVVSHNQDGIVLDSTRAVQVRDSTITANDVTGIVVKDSVNTTVHANDIRRAGDGFRIHHSTTMDLSTFAIRITGSSGTVISGNDLGGKYGSLDLGPSTATRVTGNQLTGEYCGILSLQQGKGAAVYDNVFRNSRYSVYGQLTDATWNTSPSPGPNIVGGPSIGGNFWANLDGTGFSETHPDANRDGFCDEPYTAEMAGVDQFPLAPWTGPAPGPTPYKPLSVPGRIEAEDYDLGGEAMAYHDTTTGNSGGAYRQDDVDIETTSGLSTPNVGWIRTGEYLVYTVNVTTAGTYTLTARVASPNSGRTMALSIGGTAAATIAIPNTGSFATFTNVTVPVVLPAGSRAMKLTFSGDGQNLDWIEFSPQETATPTPTPLVAVPGGAGLPTDTNADGKYDDLNGNGRSDFNDVVLFFNQMDWIAANEPLTGFDYNGNGQIDFADVVWLFNNFDAPPVRTYNVTAVAIGPGTITPSGKIAVPEGENVTFTMTHENAMPTPYSTQSGYSGGNLVLVDPSVTPTPFPTPGQWAPWVPNPSTFTPSYTLHDVRSDHTVYSSFYYTMVIC